MGFVQAKRCLGLQDLKDGFIQPCRRDFAAVDSIEHRPVGGIKVCRNEEQVIAGLEGINGGAADVVGVETGQTGHIDRKSTRLNSSHLGISYAVFCLKKKKKTNK